MKKKILKIIQIVYDILSLGFIIFVITAMSISSNRYVYSNNESSENEIVLKRRSNAIQNDTLTLTCFSQSDIFGSMFISALIDDLSVKNGLENLSPSSSTYFSYAHRYKMPASIWISVGGTSWSNYHEVRSVNITKAIDSTNQIHYSIYLNDNYDNDTSNAWIVLQYYYLRTNIFSNVDIGSQYIFTRADYRDNDYANNGWFLGEDWSRNNATIFRNVYTTLVDGYNNNAFQDGFDAGKKAGYDEGYIDGSSGIESNAFTVIGQAFEVIGNIFNINVLPNFPLWVLVFTPLIIAVVIVVVKLIKG